MAKAFFTEAIDARTAEVLPIIAFDGAVVLYWYAERQTAARARALRHER
jgi:hypothetical protein